MDIKNGSIALFVEDIERSKQFYIETLQQQIEHDFGKNVIFKSGFAIWEIMSNHIIPDKLGYEQLIDRTVNRFELYFETEDLDEIYETLKSKNITFMHQMHEEPWGQFTIRFFDPDRHLIEVGESMKRFVSRIYNQGLSAEEVSVKTGVNIEEVKRLIDE